MMPYVSVRVFERKAPYNHCYSIAFVPERLMDVEIKISEGAAFVTGEFHYFYHTTPLPSLQRFLLTIRSELSVK